MQVRQYSRGISWGEAPTKREVETLARSGYRSILNLCSEGEEGLPLSPNVEASWAHTFMLAHARVAVNPSLPLPGDVDRFLELLAAAPRPVYVHSRRGGRAAAFLAVHAALERGVPPEEALRDVEDERLGEFARLEIERRLAAPVAPSAA